MSENIPVIICEAVLYKQIKWDTFNTWGCKRRTFCHCYFRLFCTILSITLKLLYNERRFEVTQKWNFIFSSQPAPVSHIQRDNTTIIVPFHLKYDAESKFMIFYSPHAHKNTSQTAFAQGQETNYAMTFTQHAKPHPKMQCIWLNLPFPKQFKHLFL